MRNLMIIAAIMVGLGTVMAQMADTHDPRACQYRRRVMPRRSQ